MKTTTSHPRLLRSQLLRGAATLLVLLAVFDASPAAAAKKGKGKEKAAEAEVVEEEPPAPPPVEASLNSDLCRYTLFSEQDDAIDMKGRETDACFDMLGGDDLLILNRSDFPSGTRIYTGKGRDKVWATDGPDLVVDADGEDEEIRTLGGDDRIRIELAVDYDPRREVDMTGRTDIRPGAGRNSIEFGKNLYSNAFPRVSPNAWIWTEAGAFDTVDAECGRPDSGSVFDLRFVETPPDAQLEIASIGCGVGLFSMRGGLVIDQVGGRFALDTEETRFASPSRGTLPTIQGTVRNSAGGLVRLSNASEGSDLFWEGPGPLRLTSEMASPVSGGRFFVASRKQASVELTTSPSRPRFQIVSPGLTELRISAETDVAGSTIEMAGDRMDVVWSYAGGAGFPQIINTRRMSFEETIIEAPAIEYFKGTLEERTRALMLASRREEGDEGVSQELPEGVPDLVVDQNSVTVFPGHSRLQLRLRSPYSSNPACFSVRIADTRGQLDDITIACESLDHPARRAVIRDASGYDLIQVRGVDNLDIAINDAGPYRVDRLELEF